MGSSRFAEYCQSRHPRIIDMHKSCNSPHCESNAVYQMRAYWLKYKRFGTTVYRCMATGKCGANYFVKVYKLPYQYPIDPCCQFRTVKLGRF